MTELEDQEEYKEPMPALAIAGINIGSLIIYLGVIISSHTISDSVAELILFGHLAICVVFAINSKRPVWWISACIVALPLISVLTHR